MSHPQSQIGIGGTEFANPRENRGVPLPRASARPSTIPTMIARLLALLLPLVLVVASARAQPTSPKPEVSVTANAKQFIAGRQHVLAIVSDVPVGYHAQSAKPLDDNYIPFVVTLKDLPAGVTVLDPVYPTGEVKDYAALGKLSVYEGRVVVYVPLAVDPSLAAGTTLKFTGSVSSQMCDDGTCYPPSKVPFSVGVPVAAADARLEPNDPDLFRDFKWSVFAKGPTSQPAPETRPSSGAIGAAPGSPGGPAKITAFGFELSSDSVLLALSLAFVVGLIFNVMPCVLPVLPLKAVGFIQAAEHSRARAVSLGVVFSAGVVSVFAVLGLLIFVWGGQWGGLFQKAWFVYGMSAVLVLFAASQWGLWTFRLPLGVYTVEPKHDTYAGNFLFGGLTALLSTPCTAPVFPALLLWSASQPKFVGISLMLVTGIGMAVPYFLLSCFPELARKVPRTGAWSEIIKQFMGFLVLGVAAYLFTTRFDLGDKQYWPMALVGLAASIFLMLRTIQLMPRPRPVAIAAVLALLLTSTSIYAMLPAPAAAASATVIAWTPYSEQALADARAKNQVVLIDFTANWCISCHYVEKTVYGDQKVVAALNGKNVLLLKADLTSEGAPGSDLLRKLNPAGGIPLTAIYFPGSQEPVQLASIYTSETLLKTLGG